MAQLRPMKVVNVLTFEETARVSNVFMLLVEIDLRSPRSTKSKTRKNTKAKAKRKAIKEEPSYIKCPARRSSRTAWRDLFLQAYYIQNSQFFLN